ncbi:MAG: hypothetical protein ACRDNK_22105 [Solirubrobacteraceae bacterium]
MSLWATASAAVDRHRPTRPPSPLREGASGGGDPASAATDAAAQLIRYIPSELVAAYATVVGVLPLTGNSAVCHSDFGPRWIAFGVFVVLTPITLQVLYVVKRRKAASVGPRIPWFDHTAAAVAFLAWALVLPLSPVDTWCDWQPKYGVAIAAVVLLLLGLTTQLARPER